MKTREEFEKVTEIVRKLLLEDDRCKSDDKWLTFRAMQHYTKIFIPFEDFKKIPSFETISRCRRKIQETTPELRASEKIKSLRLQREREVKEIVR